MSNAWQEHSLEKYNSTCFFKKFAGSFHYLSLSIKLLFLKSERFWPFLFDIFIFKIYSIVPTYHRYLNRAKSSLKYSIELLLFRHLFIIGHSTFIALYTKMYIIVIMVYSPLFLHHFHFLSVLMVKVVGGAAAAAFGNYPYLSLIFFKACCMNCSCSTQQYIPVCCVYCLRATLLYFSTLARYTLGQNMNFFPVVGWYWSKYCK